MPTLADQIRAHIDNGAQLFEPDRAVLAVVVKCEAMRAESARNSSGIGHFLADEFESVIARELGIEP